VSGVFTGKVVPVTTIFDPTLAASGVTVRLTMLIGIVKTADFNPENGSATVSEISFGGVKLTGFDVSAACATGVMTEIPKIRAIPHRI
jgi:hypothetical protein